jgi:hypothetical protein
MALVRYLPPETIATENVMLNAFFAEKLKGGQSFYVSVEEDMRSVLAQELPALDRGLEFPEKWERVVINTTIAKDLPSTLTYREIQKLKLANVARFEAPGYVGITPLREVLLTIKKMLIKASPKRLKRSSKRTPPGTYRNSHEIFVNGSRYTGGVGRREQKENDFGQVISRLDYSAVLETPDYKYKPYQKVMNQIRRRQLWWDEYDIMMTWANPEPFGGMIYTSVYRDNYRPVYAIPVITVAPLNALPRRLKGNIGFKKRRTLSQRTNIRALIKRKNVSPVFRFRR